MSSPAGFPGIAGIVGGVIGVGIIMSLVLNMWAHWIPIAIAIVVALCAVRSINK
jgi:hypothetical protein